MGAVAAGVGAQVAVFVVEELIDVDVEDRLAVGERGELFIELIDAGVIERRIRTRARGADVQVRLDIDDGVRLRGAHGVNERGELGRDVVQIVAELVDAEHDVDLAECFLAQQLRQRDGADIFHGDGLRLRDIDVQADIGEIRRVFQTAVFGDADGARVADEERIVKIRGVHGRELQRRRLRCGCRLGRFLRRRRDGRGRLLADTAAVDQAADEKRRRRNGGHQQQDEEMLRFDAFHTSALLRIGST